MPPTIQDTLLDLFEDVRQDPDTPPRVPIENWQEGSVEWSLLSGFQGMLEQVQQRMLKFKQIEQQMGEKEEQYRAIFEATIDGLSINDLEDGRVIEANPALCEMFGYTHEEFIDLPPTATIHPDTYHVVADVLQRVQAGSQFQTRFVALRKDGTTFYAEGRGTPFIYKGKSHLLGSTRDISEQVRAEEQLREKEEQYRSVFEAATDSLTISRLEDGQIVEVNPATCKMLGFKYEELIGMLPVDLVPQDYLPLVEEGLQTLQVGGRNDLMMMTLRKDGSSFPTEVHSTQFSFKGKPHLLTVARDITERVEAEEQLREKEEQYRSVFEATDDGLNIVDLDGFYIEANPAYCKMLGYTREELIGMHYSKSTFPEYYPVLEESAQAIESGKQYQTQGLARRKDGTPLPVEAHATPFIYKGKSHILGVMRDITERVEAEEQLREKEEQYHSVFEATYDGLIISNLDGFVVEVNPAFCDMYGYVRDELIGLHVGALAASESLPILDEVLETRKTGRNYQTVVAQAMHKDGTAFYVESHGTTFTYGGQPHTLGVVRDVTERVEAEKQLREREEQYRSIFEATYDGIDIFDSNGFFVEVNPAFCNMFGYTREELIGMHASTLVAPEYLPVLDEVLETLGSSTGYQTVVGRGVRKDGAVFYTESHGTPFTYKGKLHLLGVSRDITERVEAERQLREREAQYRGVFEATYDALFIMDLDGFLVEVNPAFCRMFGYPYEEIIGLQASDLTAPVSLPNLVEALKVLKSGRGTQTEMGQGLRKNGTTFYSESQSTTFTYKGKPHALGVVRDITERVQAEEQLREKEEQYRGIFEASTDGLFIVDLEDSHVVEVNPMACQMWGYTYEEMLGRPIGISDDSQQIPIHALEVIQAGDQFQMRDITTRKDGTSFNVEVHATPFTYKGRPQLLAIVRDITEQVQAEEQLQEREAQHRSIFEATSDGLIIRDMNGFVVEANPAACNMHGYAYEEFLGLHRTDIIDAKDHAMVAEYMKAIQAGHSFLGQAVDLRKDGSSFPVEVRGTTFTYQGKPHTLSVLRDITERVAAEQQLREKEEQYRSIFEATYDGVCIYDMDGFLAEVNPAFCSMYGYTREELIGLRVSIIIPPERQHYVDHALKSLKDGGEYQALVKCVRKDGTQFYAETNSTTFTYRGKPHALGVIRDTTEQVQAKKLLEQRVEERTRELSSLLEISHTVASTLQLKPLLGLILDQLKILVDYTGSSILTLEGEDLVFLDSRNPIPGEQLLQMRFPLKNLRLIWKTITSRESIIIQDSHENSPLAHAFRVALGELLETTFSYVRACMFVPLMLREQVMGMLVLTSSEKQAFTPHHATLALAIANQAAVAIENARLYEQAQALAAFEERQRLARELHDSVSQALYGISLGVHTARMQLDRNPKELAESLDYVLELAEAALIEMRALIFELRPESLETEGLVTALTKQAAALHARQGIIVQLDLGKEPDLPLKMKQDLYRIAQEALHNTVKHARASEVMLRLDQSNNVVMMEIRDDGRGFDSTSSFPGHLGLHSMRERVTNLGGTFEIDSTEGRGTTICIRIPEQRAFQR
jgi:PAS domain S-box-containing protein